MKRFVVLAIYFSVLLASIPLQSPTATPPGASGQATAWPGTPPTQLAVGMQVQVTLFRSGEQAPPVCTHVKLGTSTKVIGQLDSGNQALIIGGPQCTAGYLWWQIKLTDGRGGWVAEGTPHRYFIAPLNGTSAPPPAPTTVATGGPSAESTLPFAAHLNRWITASYSPDERYVLTYYHSSTPQYPGAHDVGIADLWDAQSGVHLRQIVSPTPTNPDYTDVSHVHGENAAFSPDGRYIVTAQSDHGNPNMGQGTNVAFFLIVWLWDTATGALVKQYTFDESKVALSDPGLIIISPDGKQILLADSQRVLEFIAIAEGSIQEIQMGKLSEYGKLASAAYAPDSRPLAIGSDSGSTQHSARMFLRKAYQDGKQVVYAVWRSHPMVALYWLAMTMRTRVKPLMESLCCGM